MHERGTKVPGGRKIEDTLAGSNKIKNAQGQTFKRVDFPPSRPQEVYRRTRTRISETPCQMVAYDQVSLDMLDRLPEKTSPMQHAGWSPNRRLLMQDITQCILVWLACCKEVWEHWFKELENGEDEFSEVEQALFSSLVLSAISMTNSSNLFDCYKLLCAVYKTDVEGYRSICKQQKDGSVYCVSRIVKFEKGLSLPIKSIDFMGKMLEEEIPYAELEINDQEYILEPVDNLSIKIRV